MSDPLPTIAADRIRQVLLADWDPHNAARAEAAHGSYDLYIAPLREMLVGGADEEALVRWLKEREEETMCFPSLGTRRLRQHNSLVGRMGVARGTDSVFVDGALWRARQWDFEGEAPLARGDPVVVEHVNGLTLTVRPANEWEVAP